MQFEIEVDDTIVIEIKDLFKVMMGGDKPSPALVERFFQEFITESLKTVPWKDVPVHVQNVLDECDIQVAVEAFMVDEKDWKHV